MELFQPLIVDWARQSSPKTQYKANATANLCKLPMSFPGKRTITHSGVVKFGLDEGGVTTAGGGRVTTAGGEGVVTAGGGGVITAGTCKLLELSESKLSKSSKKTPYNDQVASEFGDFHSS